MVYIRVANIHLRGKDGKDGELHGGCCCLGYLLLICKGNGLGAAAADKSYDVPFHFLGFALQYRSYGDFTKICLNFELLPSGFCLSVRTSYFTSYLISKNSIELVVNRRIG